LLYALQPRQLLKQGANPLQTRFQRTEDRAEGLSDEREPLPMLSMAKPEEAERLFKEAQTEAQARYSYYKMLADMDPKLLLGELPAAPVAPPTQA
jgi:hypothetical protein